MLHECEPLSVDEVASIGVERQVDADDVGLAEDVLPACLGCMMVPKNVWCDVGVVGQHAHVEGLHPLVDFAGDIAEAQQPDGFVGQAHDGVEEVVVPDATVDRRNGLWDFAHDAQQHGQRVISDFLDAVVGHVDHHDTMVGCCRHIDTVVADAVADDHLELGECGKDLAGEGCVLIQQCLGVGALGDDVGGGFALADFEADIVIGEGGAFVIVVGVGRVGHIDGA